MTQLMMLLLRPAAWPVRAPPPICADSELRVRTYSSLIVRENAPMTLQRRLAQLDELAAAHGQALPTADNADASLVRWASRQRTLRRKGALSSEVIEELDAVQFVWDPLQAAWDTRYDELEAFYAEHCHCNVPTEWPDAPGLASWLARQRTLGRRGGLPAARREALALLDFEFDPLTARWGGEGCGMMHASACPSPEPVPSPRPQARGRGMHGKHPY